MANQLRYRSGDVQLLKAPVDSATVIEAGDLVYLDGTEAKPASDFTWNTNLATTQADFAAQFLGVAHEQSASGEAEPISVNVSPQAVYEFDADTSTYGVGDLLGPDESSSTLMDQQLELVAAAGQAIARSVENHDNNTSSLRVTLASAYATGSANTNAAIG